MIAVSSPVPHNPSMTDTRPPESPTKALAPIPVTGPHFEDFRIGQQYDAPAVTLTSGHAALYQAITGDRLRLPLDHHLSRRLTGLDRPLAHPMLVINLAIGQTTWASQRVKANLFYRGLILRRPVLLDDTLHTTSRVVALKQNTIKPGRPATGIVALEMVSRNQHDEEVLHFWRCPMIPCRSPDAATGHGDDLTRVGTQPDVETLRQAAPTNWQLEALRSRLPTELPKIEAGMRLAVEARDTVTSAPELVRATLNMAMAHTDAKLSYLGERLVYGGHTVSIAFAQITRAIPSLITLLAWESCDHVAPVIENDRLRSEVFVTAIEQLASGRLLRLRVETFAARGNHEEESKVLDWRLVAWAL